MNNERDFVRSLSKFLALHTQQSPGYFNHLIESFMRGVNSPPNLESTTKDEIARRLKAEMEATDNVPSFLQYYLLRNLMQDSWTPEAAFIASRYVRRGSGERFVAWQRRQQLVAELDGESIRGTELGVRQLLYSQGAGTVFQWRGVPCFKTVYDLAIYAMLIDELRPHTIIELGSGAGGSALLFADLCTSVGLTTQIMSIDKAAVAEISDPRITFIQSDCSDWLEETARSNRDFPGPCLLVEDFHDDLAGFFEHIDLILNVGDYLVIEDSNPKRNQISRVMEDRSYRVDSKYTDFFGINCTSAIDSIFMKNADTRAPQLRTRREGQLLREQDRAWRQRITRDT